MRSTLTNRPGFSLLEVMVIVIVLGLLALVVTPQFGSAAIDTRAESIATQTRAIELQLELYRGRYGSFPSRALMAAPPSDPTKGGAFGVLIDNSFIKRAPVNPYTGGDALTTDWVYDEIKGSVVAVAGS